MPSLLKESVKRCAVLSLKPESQFGIYTPEESSCGTRNMNVVGPPKTAHVRGHNGCVLVVLHFWE